jgi:hypothetical protein
LDFGARSIAHSQTLAHFTAQQRKNHRTFIISASLSHHHPSHHRIYRPSSSQGINHARPKTHNPGTFRITLLDGDTATEYDSLKDSYMIEQKRSLSTQTPPTTSAVGSSHGRRCGTRSTLSTKEAPLADS